MSRTLMTAMLGGLFVTSLLQSQPKPNDPRAVALMARAMERMGGEASLRAVKSLRMDVMTQWQRTHLGAHPYSDQPSYERNVDLRDYTTNSWRNTRDFLGNGAIVDVVRDSVGGRTMNRPNGAPMLTTLNVAYRDERRELFAFAPERTLWLARDNGGLTLLADTTIDGIAHARIAGTVDGYAATYFMRRTDGLPAMIRFRADETNDFGLAPWGEMEVELWYSAWARVAPGVIIPRQRDVRRVGRPYKRMTILTATINAPAPADSFVITDSIVSAYLANERKPMWDAPLDTVKVFADHFVGFPPFTGSSGAVRVGGKWVLLETGQATGAADRLNSWFARNTAETPIGAALMTHTNTGNGGVSWFLDHRVPVYAPNGSAPILRAMIGPSKPGRVATTVSAPKWIRVGSDSLWVEPLDVPDLRTVLTVYSPTHRWLYAPIIGNPTFKADQDALIARLRERGLAVEWLGSTRGVRIPAPK